MSGYRRVSEDFYNGMRCAIDYVLLGDIVDWPSASEDVPKLMDMASEVVGSYDDYIYGIRFVLFFLLFAGIINSRSQEYYILLGCLNYIGIDTCRKCVSESYAPSE